MIRPRDAAATRIRSLRGDRTLAANALIVLLSIPVIFYGLGNYSLVSGDEGFYHYAAREMVRTGDWFTLRFDGETQLYETFLNAPLHYWMKALLISCFGDSYWTMRVLAALFALLTVLATYRLAAYLANPTSALLASLLQLTTFQFVYWHSARTGELEPIVTFLIVMTVYLFLRALDTGRGFLLHHCFLVALVNFKLPLVLLPVIAEAAYFLLNRETRVRFREWLLSGLLLLPVAFLWHGYQAVQHRSEIAGVLRELLANAERAPGETRDRASIIVDHLRFYLLWMWRGAFPYVFAYPVALLAALTWVRADAVPRPSSRARWAFIAIQTLTIVGFYALIVKRLAWYIVPCYPFLSVLTGVWFDSLWRGRHGLPTMLAIAAILSSVAWMQFPIVDVNPFSANVRYATDAVIRWQTLLGVGASIGAPLTLVVLTVIQLAARSLSPARAAKCSAATLGGILIAVASARTLAPLRFVNHKSEMQKVHDAVVAARATDRTLIYPIQIREPGILKAKYFFGDDFDIRIQFAVEDSVFFELHPKTAGDVRHSQ